MRNEIKAPLEGEDSRGLKNYFSVFWVILLFLCCSNTILAQQDVNTIVVKGLITDASNMPLLGVTVQVKNSLNGEISDFDGNYSITVTEENPTLIFSYVGYLTKEVLVDGQTTINVVLQEDAAQLEEVVVTALGIKKEKKRIGYATQEVKGDALNTVQTANVVESLSGKVAGITIVSNAGNFFSDPQIYLRGEKPLIVVDGVPQPNSDFWNLSSDDIENINVLKGAAASLAQYWQVLLYFYSEWLERKYFQIRLSNYLYYFLL